jgi:hypothetical protein
MSDNNKKVGIWSSHKGRALSIRSLGRQLFYRAGDKMPEDGTASVWCPLLDRTLVRKHVLPRLMDGALYATSPTGNGPSREPSRYSEVYFNAYVRIIRTSSTRAATGQGFGGLKIVWTSNHIHHTSVGLRSDKMDKETKFSQFKATNYTYESHKSYSVDTKEELC